ncbi:MAG: class I SAM-dependent methyltransferase [Crocinitomicaceae bacterium]
MNFLDEEIDKYVCEHTENEPQELYELNRETHLNVLIPRMLSGHFQGRLLSMLSHMIQPKNVLEIGTYTGYSALCFAEGLQKDGKIITIDKNDELEEIIEKYISKTNNQDRIQFLKGDAATSSQIYRRMGSGIH